MRESVALPSVHCMHPSLTATQAYGGTPRPVLAAQHAYGARMEADIDPWMNSPSGYRACIVAARQAIAALTNATTADGDGAEDIVLVDNATEGVNDVLRNLEPPLGADQWIFDLSTAYAPFAGLYQWLGARVGVRVLTADIVFPVTGAESFLAPVRATVFVEEKSAPQVLF